jgi:hypothetical protein
MAPPRWLLSPRKTNGMASPTKPLAPIRHRDTVESDLEFEAAIERVQRRETTAPRKGFDEQRQSEDHPPAEPDTETVEPASPLAVGDWTPFSDE